MFSDCLFNAQDETFQNEILWISLESTVRVSASECQFPYLLDNYCI